MDLAKMTDKEMCILYLWARTYSFPRSATESKTFRDHAFKQCREVIDEYIKRFHSCLEGKIHEFEKISYNVRWDGKTCKVSKHMCKNCNGILEEMEEIRDEFENYLKS